MNRPKTIEEWRKLFGNTKEVYYDYAFFLEHGWLHVNRHNRRTSHKSTYNIMYFSMHGSIT